MPGRQIGSLGGKPLGRQATLEEAVAELEVQPWFFGSSLLLAPLAPPEADSPMVWMRDSAASRPEKASGSLGFKALAALCTDSGGQAPVAGMGSFLAPVMQGWGTWRVTRRRLCLP